MSQQKQLRPRNTQADNNRLKLHLRLIKIGAEILHVITLRPGTQVAFSTNYFHDTWHIITDSTGAKCLARLLWGLAFQKVPNTLVVIHGEHIKPTPFDADPSDPIVLLPAHLTSLDAKLLQTLKHHLKSLEAPQQTIRWQTFGLDIAIADNQSYWNSEDSLRLGYKDNEHLWRQERMCRCGGFVCYAAPLAVLRQQARIIYSMKTSNSFKMDYHYLAEPRRRNNHHADGEVQIFGNYRRMLSTAAVARNKVTAQLDEPVATEELHRLIYQAARGK